ncbi:glycosyltransferase family 61 protein [uncultured Pontibacter sp.]|uniref:glycosyltransferase family 61 protein n=1 Tax=uncultured Pontibacter sp. TaxID=453356 RepID=UPI002631C805|nr:glycosyltransferase family 61 protein [uncultured Pontibacter sp.]
MLQISKLYTRIHRKINRILERHIPYNQTYKPTGHYNNISDYVAATGAACVEVYPPEESTLDIPEELLVGSKNYNSIPRTGVQHAAVVTAVNRGRLYTDATHFAAVISEDNKVIGDLSLHVGTTQPEENGIFRKSYFTTPLGLKGNAFHTLIGGSGENNYFHWMFDSLPRMHLLEKAGLLHKMDWFVVPKHNLPYQKDTLRLLGIPNTKIVEGHDVHHVQADTMYASTFVRNIEHIPMWACQYLRDKFLPIAQKIIQPPKRIYISRQDSDARNVTNEVQVIALLEKYGFKKVVLSDFTFAEQVSMFQSAEAIVGPHGAGLTNLVFCQKGTQVIELFAKEYLLTLYTDLATKVGLDYNYLISHTYPKATNLRQAMNKGIQVPLDKLEELVQGVLTRTPEVMEQSEQKLKVV